MIGEPRSLRLLRACLNHGPMLGPREPDHRLPGSLAPASQGRGLPILLTVIICSKSIHAATLGGERLRRCFEMTALWGAWGLSRLRI